MVHFCITKKLKNKRQSIKEITFWSMIYYWSVQRRIKFPSFPIGAVGYKYQAEHGHEFQLVLFFVLNEILFVSLFRWGSVMQLKLGDTLINKKASLAHHASNTIIWLMLTKSIILEHIVSSTTLACLNYASRNIILTRNNNKYINKRASGYHAISYSRCTCKTPQLISVPLHIIRWKSIVCT